MKSFRFSMQGMLDVKETLKTVSEINLAQAQKLVRVEEEALLLIDRKVERLLQEDDLDGGVREPAYFVQRTKHLEELRLRRAEQEANVEEAREKETEFRQDLIDAETELKKMERVCDQEERHWQQVAFREEQRFNDEVASAMRLCS